MAETPIKHEEDDWLVQFLETLFFGHFLAFPLIFFACVVGLLIFCANKLERENHFRKDW
jgi:hypothetical protein